MAKRTVRKPRALINTTSNYPRIENDDAGRIWIQAVPTGKWKKVPLERAKSLLDRFSRVIAYAQQNS